MIDLTKISPATWAIIGVALLFVVFGHWFFALMLGGGYALGKAANNLPRIR